MSKEPVSHCYYLGESYPLYAVVDESVAKLTVEFDGTAFTCKSPTPGAIDLSEALKSFYMKASRKVINERLKLYQPEVKVKYRDVTIENSNKKWGSCSSERHLTFHWKLVLYPMKAIDYVVVHELCHLIHLNHDRSFWRLVGKIMPDYKEAMALLGTTSKDI